MITFIKTKASEVRPGALVMWETENARLVRAVREVALTLDGSGVMFYYADAPTPGIYTRDTILWVAQRA